MTYLEYIYRHNSVLNNNIMFLAYTHEYWFMFYTSMKPKPFISQKWVTMIIVLSIHEFKDKFYHKIDHEFWHLNLNWRATNSRQVPFLISALC